MAFTVPSAFRSQLLVCAQPIPDRRSKIPPWCTIRRIRLAFTIALFSGITIRTSLTTRLVYTNYAIPMIKTYRAGNKPTLYSIRQPLEWHVGRSEEHTSELQ